MRWLVAVLLVTAALVAGAVWLGFGEAIVGAGAGAGSNEFLAEAAPAGAAAPEDEEEGDPSQAEVPAEAPWEGYSAEEPLVEEPVRRFEEAESVLDPAMDYRAVLETTAGPIVVDLYDDQAPRTVNNFVFLALHRFYEDVPFHRVLDEFMAQTGDPTGTGTGGPGYVFDDEIVTGLEHDRPGLLSMANAGPNTNGSQFFITFAATPWLDGAHAVFGEVLEGMETLDALTRIDPQAPSALARLSEPVSALAEQGVTSLEDASGTVGSWLEEELGAMPAQGQSFQIRGRRGVLGNISGAPALGLFPVPDRIERVTIFTAPEEDPS